MDNFNFAEHPDRNCRGLSPAFMHPDRAEHVAASVAVCDGCCVKAACGEYAIHDPSLQGVWGGLSEADRRRIRRDRGIVIVSPRAPVAACGTPSGYARHRRLGEPVCEPCKKANSRASYDRLVKLRARRAAEGRVA